MWTWAPADYDGCVAIQARQSRLLRCVQEELRRRGEDRGLQTLQVVDMQRVQVAATRRTDDAAAANAAAGDAAAGDATAGDAGDAAVRGAGDTAARDAATGFARGAAGSAWLSVDF